jgi:beta-lactamase regulating signal transducer with metallopeptidase domain
MTDIFIFLRGMESYVGTAPGAEIVLRATALLLAAIAIAFFLRRSSAELRHLVWTLSLAGALLIPLFYLSFPAWRWAVLPAPAAAPISDEQNTPIKSVSSPAGRDAHQAAERVSGHSLNLPDKNPLANDRLPEKNVSGAENGDPAWKKTAAYRDSSPAEYSLPARSRSACSWPKLLAGVWLAGTFCALAWTLIGIILAWRVARRSAPDADSNWRPILRKLNDKYGVSFPVEIGICSQLSVPMTWGFLRPMILVPANGASWPEDVKRSVLLHELGHIRRRDCLFHFLGRLASAAYWFHPLVWYAVRQLRKTSEQAADDAVLRWQIAPPDYAEHLLRIAAEIRGQNFFAHAVLPMANASDLSERVEAILDSGTNHRTLTRKTCIASTVLALFLFLPCALLCVGYAQVNNDSRLEASDKSPVAQTESRSNGVRLSGIVYRSDGKPAAGARVWAAAVFVSPHLRHFTDADAEGRFKFDLVPLNDPEKWTVHARLGDEGGEANDAYGSVKIRKGDNPKSVEIRLAPRGWLRGKVLESETQKPIAGAKLFLDSGDIVTTDADGRYEVGGQKMGSRRMTIVAPGRSRKYFAFDTSLRKEAQLDIELPKGGRIVGRVADQDDQPVPGAYVARHTSGNALALNGLDESCDEQGLFVWDGMPLNQLIYVFSASANGYEDDDLLKFTLREGEQPMNVVFRLKRKDTPIVPKQEYKKTEPGPVQLPKRDLEGIVLSPAGDPIHGAAVRWGATQYEETKRETKTDEQGRFVLPQVPDRAGYVTVIAKDCAPCFEMVMPGNKKVKIELEKGKFAAGTVQSGSGRPLPGVYIVPVISSPDPSLCNPLWLGERSATTDDQGRFEIQGLPSGPVRFDFMCEGLSELRNHELEIGSRDNIVRMGATGAVHGIVLDPRGKPVRNFRICLKAPRQRDNNLNFGGFDATFLRGVWFTSDDGTFTVSELEAGTYVRVVAIAEGYGQAAVDLQKVYPLTDLPPAGDLRLQLTEPHSLRVHLTDKADPQKAVADAAVSMIDEDPEAMRGFSWGYHNLGGQRVYSAADGWAAFPDVPLDNAILTVECPGYARQKLSWRKDQKEIDVALEKEAVLSGLVELDKGRPLAHYYASLSNGADNYSLGIQAKDKGRFRFDQLPAGKYTLTIRDERQELNKQDVILEPGKTQEIRINLSGNGNESKTSQNRPSSNPNSDDKTNTEAAKGNSGLVLQSDGKAAVNAMVMVATARNHAYLENGRVHPMNPAPTYQTNSQGRFSFTTPGLLGIFDSSYHFIVVHDSGFADASQDDFAKTGTIALRPWGRLEGTMRIGRELAKNEQVIYEPNFPRELRIYIYDGSNRTITDDKGHFVMDRLIPGKGFAARVVVEPAHIGTVTGQRNTFIDRTNVEITAGKSAYMDLGGRGRPVAGRLDIDNSPIKITKNTFGSIVPKTRAENDQSNIYSFHIKPDGSFRVDDVLPGDYILTVDINKDWERRDNVVFVGSRLEQIGVAKVSFSMPEIPGGYSDEPLDIGTLKINPYED